MHSLLSMIIKLEHEFIYWTYIYEIPYYKTSDWKHKRNSKIGWVLIYNLLK